MLLGDDLSWSDEWESEILVDKLIGVVSLQFLIPDDRGLDDLDVTGHSSVSTCHVAVHITNSTSQTGSSVLLVHIVCSTSGSVSEPDGEVLNLGWSLVEDLSDIENLTTSSLGLSQRLHIIPELRFSNNGVASEDLHSVDLWAGVLGGWSSSTNKLIEVHLDDIYSVDRSVKFHTFMPREATE